jgi:predicted Fe-Mo cluster-binding NifX family protein
MKIGIPSFGTNLDSFVDPRFARANYFVILDEKGEIEKVIENPAAQVLRGANALASQVMIENAVSSLVVANIEPSAFDILESAGIKVFQGQQGLTVRELFNLYKEGKVQRLRKRP